MATAWVLLLASCAPWEPAPVENRSERPATRAAPSRPQAPPANYEVSRGDTLYSIAFRFGLDWRAVANWNALEAPYLIRPGQSLRLSEPPRVRPTPTRIRPRAEIRTRQPVPTPSTESETTPAEGGSSEPSNPAVAAVETVSRAAPPAPSAGSDSRVRSVAGVDWRWPTTGAVARPFDASAARRGLGIRGQAGQAIVAAADGEVVYSGTALIGYGELIIIKHSNTMLSAYGHNRRRLVSEGSRVQAGQVIAEMGLDETDEAILHFEIRRNGQPENPGDFLPPRR